MLALIQEKPFTLQAVPTEKRIGKNMKKIFFFAALLFAGTLFFASCKSSAKCSAYGETHKFQKEVRY